MKRLLPLAIATVVFLAFGILWIVSDRRATERVFDDYSSANTGMSGLSLATEYLAASRKVEMLTRPLGRARLESNAVVFRVHDSLPRLFDPESLAENQVGPPKPTLRPLLDTASEEFVRRGGRLVVAAMTGALDSEALEEESATKVFPIWPGVERIDLAAALDVCECVYGFTSLPPRMVPLFVSGTRPVVVRERIGAGELYVLSIPDVLQNYMLSDNLALLEALAGEKRPVYFDETIHGIVSDDGALALMKEWNLGPFLLLAALTALLVFWRAGKRVGPAEEEHRETRSDAIDLVRSLGALYGERTSDAEAIALYHEALTRAVAHASGLRGEALHKRVDELTGGFVPPKSGGRMPRAVFEKQLAVLNDAFLTGTMLAKKPAGRSVTT